MPGTYNDRIGDFTMDAKTNSKSATLTVGGKSYDFPVKSGSVGPDVIDISKLYAQAGMFTYDPGFTSTEAANPRSPISTATPASCCIVATRSNSLPRRVTS